jgi:acyl carrier protein
VDQQRPVDFESFRALVSGVLEVDDTAITGESRFVEDLGLDSLTALTLSVEIEVLLDRHQSTLDVDWFLNIRTVRDAYLYYLERASMPVEPLTEGVIESIQEERSQGGSAL